MAQDLIQASIYQSYIPAPLAANGNPELVTTALAFTPLDVSTSPASGTTNNAMNAILNPTRSVESALPNDYGVQFCLRINSTASANDRYSYYLQSLTGGATYQIVILSRHVSGDGNTRVVINTADDTSNTLTSSHGSSTWTLHSGTFIPTGTQQRLDLYANYLGATPAGSSDYIITVKLQ